DAPGSPRLQCVVAGGASVGALGQDASELRIRAEKLTLGHGALSEDARSHQPVEWVGYLLRETGAQTQILIGQLIQIDVDGQSSALASRVSHIEHHAPSEIPLYIEIPLLGVTGVIASQVDRNGLPDQTVQAVDRAGRKHNTVGER